MRYNLSDFTTNGSILYHPTGTNCLTHCFRTLQFLPEIAIEIEREIEVNFQF